MNKFPLQPRNKSNGILAMVISTLLITLFLFYIDEGYYDFRWMNEPGNWLAFLIYATVIFLGQLLFFKVLFRNYQGGAKTILSIICGSILGIFLLVMIFYALRGFRFIDGLA
jgi:putative effector of murein hydrolase